MGFDTPTQPPWAASGGIKIRFLRNRILYIGGMGFPLYCFLVRQACAALGAATGQYLAAVRRAHTLAEAMLLGALALLGLIRSLHFLVHLPV